MIRVKSVSAIIAAILLAACGAPEDAGQSAQETAQMKKATPILFVDNVQASVDFFTEKLGFTKTIEVPYERGLQFAAVEQDGIEIMFQASDVDDPSFTPEEMKARAGKSMIYFEVDDFDKILEAAKSADIFKDAHVTDYGSQEIYIREPGGNILGFAKHATG